ncbi:MAG: hypothetical protein P8K81_08135 [Flavobacteriales bacterium]|nr:hypothetical protein [Flavobacteriales bacterium]
MFVIAAVTAAMIAILSAFNGIESVVSDLFGTLDAPIALIPETGPTLPDSIGAWATEQWGIHSAEPLILAAAPVIEEESVVSFGTGPPMVVSVLAFDSLLFQGAPIERALASGAWVTESMELPCVTLGIGVRNILGVGRAADGAERAYLQFRAPIRGMQLSKHKDRAFRTVDALSCDKFSINADLDSRFVLAPLSMARELFDRPTEVSRFELALAPNHSEKEVADIMAAAIESSGLEVRVRTRSEKNKLITQTNRAEKWATFVILSFILVVAAFNVMASLTMLLLDKKEDLTVLHAMGLSGRRLEQAFSLQGVLINALGGILGVVVGVLIVWGQQTYGWIALQGSVIPAYPVRLELWDVLGTLLVVILIGGLGSAWMVKNLVRRLLK